MATPLEKVHLKSRAAYQTFPKILERNCVRFPLIFVITSVFHKHRRWKNSWVSFTSASATKFNRCTKRNRTFESLSASDQTVRSN